jgi:hypothetical protein
LVYFQSLVQESLPIWGPQGASQRLEGLGLLLSVIQVSVQTMELVSQLPKIKFE